MTTKPKQQPWNGLPREAVAGGPESGSTVRIAVFGDVHGHLRLLFELCRRWQVEHGAHLDGIFQCGDMGFFPDEKKIDKATRRYALKDPEELGYATFFAQPEFLRKDPRLQATLLGPPGSLDTVRCPLLWCHGNHEDFAALEHLLQGRDLVPVDPHGRLLLLAPGTVTDFRGLRVAALGGMSESHSEDLAEEDPLISRWKHVDPDAGLHLMQQSFDVLLTHTSPRGPGGSAAAWGSPWIAEVIAHCQPQFNFYGHHTQPVPPFSIARTQCHWLNDVTFARKSDGTPGPLEQGCMGILESRDGSDFSFHLVEDPWFKGLGAWNWRHG